MNKLNLRALNSATKYPSISTYHALDPKNGNLIEDQPTLFPAGSRVVATEKVDGTNVRIIVIGDDWFVASREELLAAKGDRIWNNKLDIVSSVRETAQTVAERNPCGSNMVLTVYVELYGLRCLPAWKLYGNGQLAGLRLFDISVIPLDILNEDIERIASWRDHGGQHFLGEENLRERGRQFELKLAPRLAEMNATLPTDLQGMRDLLARLAPRSRVSLDMDSAIPKFPEGIVFRSMDRSIIAKARFEDYDKTLKRMTGKEERRDTGSH